jgi:hypothetical protein
MKKIEELTEENIKKIPQYVDEWVKRGLTTERRTLEDATRDFTDFQINVLKMEKPAAVVMYDSPSECWEAVVNSQEGTPEQLDHLRKNFVYPHFDCQFWATWFSFYEFIRVELGVKYDNDVEYQSMLRCVPYGMVWPLENICVVCQPPSIIEKNDLGLHCETGPAVSYSGKNEIYSLNGVVVPKELVMTPSEDLSMEFFKKETNADVKAEFVRKYGIERMVDFGKVTDSYENYDQEENPWWWKSEYKLIDMNTLFEGVPYQPYLKMLNQTTGIWHMEACSPQCLTLRDAVKERFGGRDMKILSIA